MSSATKQTKTTPDVETKAGTAVVPASPAALPSKMMAAYADVIKASQDEAAAMTRADFSMPFLAIVQSLSPQRQKGDPKYIDGAEEGDIFNTVTGELFKVEEGVRLIPVKYELVFNVWRPRDLGGGFLGSFPSEIDKETGKDRGQQKAVDCAVSFIMGELADVKSTELAAEIAVRRDKTGWVRDTANQYVLVETHDGDWTPALLSLTATKLTPGRKWNTRIQMWKPSAGRAAVRWNGAWKLVTTQQKNEEGVFYNIRVPEPDGETTAAQWQAAADFHMMLGQGLVKVEYDKTEDAPTVDDSGPAM